MFTSSLACLLFGGFVSASTSPVVSTRSKTATNLTALSLDNINVYCKNGRIEGCPKAKYEYLSGLEGSAFELIFSPPLSTFLPSPSNRTTLSYGSNS
jgi:hypothetical protein